MALAGKRARFVQEFVVDLNGRQAAIRAGYSPRTATEQAHEMLRQPDVAAAINAAKAERSEETKIDAAWVLKRLAAEAEADVGDLYDDAGDLLPVKQWPKIWRQGLVAGLDVEVVTVEGREVARIKKLRLSDRVRRLELIGKHIGVKAFEDTLNLTGLNALAERLARASKRMEDDAATLDECEAKA